jgi:hypothetical protein
MANDTEGRIEAENCFTSTHITASLSANPGLLHHKPGINLRAGWPFRLVVPIGFLPIY